MVYKPGHGPPPPAAEIGGKAFNLARLDALGERVPSWIAIGIGAAERFAADDVDGAFPDALRHEVQAALAEARLDHGLLAVRSSASVEDAATASFAGQFDSVLGVTAAGTDLWEAIQQVWTSAGNTRATAYQQQQAGREAEPVRMGVVIQRMIDSVVSGVAFSADPVTLDPDIALVSAVYGIGEGLVSGEFNADTYRVQFQEGRPSALVAEIDCKENAFHLRPEGGLAISEVPAPLQNRPALTDEEAKTIAATARRLANRLGAPQDVEWALADEEGEPRRLFILQTRPITTLSSPVRTEPPIGERRLWDNSNIIESYAGVTTPLTFSFARSVYEDVYLQFSRLMGVNEDVLTQQRHVFANMLGLIRGRVYYNLLNWYRALSLLPGYSLNRAFMERMMGVREKLDDPPEPPYVAGK